MKKIDITTITADKLKNGDYKQVLPEYYELAEVSENGLWHDNQNVLDHVIEVFASLEIILSFEFLTLEQKTKISQYLQQKIGTFSRQDLLKIATLLHDIAKKDTLVMNPDGSANCPGHELIGAARVPEFSQRFGLSQIEAGYVERIVRYHGFVSQMVDVIGDHQTLNFEQLFSETVGDVGTELLLLLYADELGCDLAVKAPDLYQKRHQTILSLLTKLIAKL